MKKKRDEKRRIFTLRKGRSLQRFNAMDDSFNWKWQLRGNCGKVSCKWGNWVFHWFMHSKKIYEPRETFGILLLPKITPLLTKPLLPYYPFGIPRAWTMGYKAKLLFSRLQKDSSRSKGLDADSSCCISFGLTEILLLAACPLAWPSLGPLLYYYYYYFFLFPSFWDLRPSWSFLTSWVGPSFVKAHGLSLLFIEWAFLSNFGPQH